MVSTTTAKTITAACTAVPEPKKSWGEASMKDVNVYPAPSGGWIYAVWIAARPVVVGWCLTREAAEYQAAVA
jgi:hypothetical protein